MEWVETTGRTVAEALDAALDQLGVDEQDAEVQVVAEPQKGLFGRLRSEARVRARVRPTRPRPKTERRERRGRRGSDRERRGRGAAGGSGGSGSAGTKAGGSGAKVAASNRKDAEEPANGASEQPESEGANGAESGSGTRKRRRRRGNRSKQQGATVTNVRDESTGTGTEAGFDLDAQKAAVEEFLEGLVEALGRPEATVTTRVVEEDTIEADVDGEELGLLVGPKGQTLQALHELVRSMVQRQFVGQAHARVRLDVGGYRMRRREALERFTRKVAEEVVASGEAKRLEPMAPSDRKVVHDTANEIEGVKTISEGEEPTRRVVIQPE